MKIHPLGAELFHADRQTSLHTDMTKLSVFFEILQTPLKGLFDDILWQQRDSL